MRTACYTGKLSLLSPLRRTNCNLAGETFAATSAEYFSLKQQLESESFAPEVPDGPPRFYSQLPHEQRTKLLKERLKKYTQRVSPCQSHQSPQQTFWHRFEVCSVLSAYIKAAKTSTLRSAATYDSSQSGPCLLWCSTSHWWSRHQTAHHEGYLE